MAARSTGTGAEVQKPFVTVVIGRQLRQLPFQSCSRETIEIIKKLSSTILIGKKHFYHIRAIGHGSFREYRVAAAQSRILGGGC